MQTDLLAFPMMRMRIMFLSLILSLWTVILFATFFSLLPPLPLLHPPLLEECVLIMVQPNRESTTTVITIKITHRVLIVLRYVRKVVESAAPLTFYKSLVAQKGGPSLGLVAPAIPQVLHLISTPW